MKTKKQFTNRILSIVLALVMVVGMLPMMPLTAFAAANLPKTLCVGDTAVVLDSTVQSTTSGSGWSFDSTTATLTLNDGCSITSSTLSGRNCAIYCDGDLNIVSNGSVAVTGHQYVIVMQSGHLQLNVQSGNLIVKDGDPSGVGIYLLSDADMAVNVAQGAVLDILSHSSGIEFRSTEKQLSFAGKGTVNVKTSISSSTPLFLLGSLKIDGVTMNITGVDGSNCENIYGENVTIGETEGATVNLLGNNDCGIEAGGVLSIYNGSILYIAAKSGTTYVSGITADTVNVSNSTVIMDTLNGTMFHNYGFYANLNVSGNSHIRGAVGSPDSKRGFASGTVNVTGNYYYRTTDAEAFSYNKLTAKNVDYFELITESHLGYTYTEQGHTLQCANTACPCNATILENEPHNYVGGSCINPSTCDPCGRAGSLLPHSYSYSANENVITETCSYGCGHSATATITAENKTYTGSAITNAAQVTYSDGWAGSKEHGEIIYSNNLNAGDATAKVTIEGKEISTTFQIAKADLSSAIITLNPASVIYNGTKQEPTASVVWNNMPLTENTDYIVSWDKLDFTNADTYTVRIVGAGNFTGSADKSFTINVASLTDVKVEQTGTLTYNGKAQRPTVSANAVAVNGQQITFAYSVTQSGPFDEVLPTFTEAGEYEVWYQVSAPNHETENGCFTVTVDKAPVTEPTIESKTYTGGTLTADITDTDRYTVTQNNGGTGAGKYDVVLTLKDSANYQWATTENAAVTLTFEITQATNEWTTDPTISGWTYGETANTPVGAAKFGDVKVVYSGKANDGSDYNSEIAPTKAGSYTATFTVTGNDNYTALTKDVPFTVEKATYDMSGAKWNYTEAFQYNGKVHKVEVNGLPDGVTASGYAGNTAAAVGNYTATVTLSYDANNYNTPVVADLNWKIENNWNPAEYTVSALNANGWLNEGFVITAEEGFLLSLNDADYDLVYPWVKSIGYPEETADGSVTFYLKNTETGAISLGKTVTYKLDKTPATGKVSFDERNGWEEFLNTISFGLFYKDEVTVKVEATDTLSGVAKIEYIESAATMSLEEVKAAEGWTAMPENGVGVTLEDAKQFVYYIRITDNAGNVSYLSTDGAEYDTTAPVIIGIENGKTYYTMQRFRVTERNFESVTVNGVLSIGFALGGDVDKEYVIVATDKAGNETTVIVTMKPISDLSAPIDNLTKDNVNSGHEGIVDEVKAAVEAIDTTNATEEEKAALKAIADKADELKQVIDDIKAETAGVLEEQGKYDGDTVKATDQDAIEQIIEDIDALLETENLTEDERKALEDAKEKAEGLLDIIEEAAKAPNTENTEKVEDVTSENVTPEDKTDLEKAKEDLEEALEDYGDNYTEDEKKAIEDELGRIDDALEVIGNVEAVEELIDQLPEEIRKSDEAAIKAADDAYNALSDYEKSLVDQDAKKALDDAKAALAELNKNADPSSPATGDDSNLWVWLVILLVCVAGIVGIILYNRKRRSANKR